jgi:hypothetical protein
MDPSLQFEFPTADPIPLTFRATSTGPVCQIWVLVRLLPLLVYRYILFSPENPAIRCGCMIAVVGIDFWFAQNIAGPLLFGIRWSTNALENHRNALQIEQFGESPTASHLWWLLLIPPGFWGMMVLRYMIQRKPTVFSLLLMNFLFAACNAWCFWKVSSENGVGQPEFRDERVEV